MYRSAVSPAPLCIAGPRVPRETMILRAGHRLPRGHRHDTRATMSRGDSTSRRGGERGVCFWTRNGERRERPAAIQRLCSTRRRAHSRVDNSTGIDQRTVEPRGRDQSHVLARVTARRQGTTETGGQWIEKAAANASGRSAGVNSPSALAGFDLTRAHGANLFLNGSAEPPTRDQSQVHINVATEPRDLPLPVTPPLPTRRRPRHRAERFFFAKKDTGIGRDSPSRESFAREGKRASSGPS